MELIKHHEGLRLTAYPDPATGGDPWTIGYGHTRGVKQGDTCTWEQAESYLEDDLQLICYDCIEKYVDVELTQNQFDALCSWIFNLGCANFKNSTLLTLLNHGKYEEAARQFGRWNKANGTVMAGLTKRRESERDLFLA